MSSRKKKFEKAVEESRQQQISIENRMEKLRKSMVVLGVVLAIASFFFFRSPGGQLILKTGLSGRLLWGYDVEDYELTLYVMEKDGELELISTKPAFGDAPVVSTVSGADGDVLLTTTRGWVENGKAKSEQLYLYAMRVEEPSDYSEKSFEHGPAKFEVSLREDVLIVLCITSAESSSSEELLDIAMETAKAGE